MAPAVAIAPAVLAAVVQLLPAIAPVVGDAPPLPLEPGFTVLPPTAAEPALAAGLAALPDAPPEPAFAGAAPLPPLAAGVPALDCGMLVVWSPELPPQAGSGGAAEMRSSRRT